jgi:hypothetical protein
MGIKIETKDNKVEFGVMSIPNRKQKVLYCTRGAMIDMLAYFRSDEHAEKFEKIIDFIIDTLGTDKEKPD